MKLAEALLLRSEYQKKVENLQSRILANIKIQDKDKPLENPQELIDEAFRTSEQLCDLIKKINACNNSAKLPTGSGKMSAGEAAFAEGKCTEGQTISEAIVERDMLLKKRNLLASIASRALESDYRLTHTEVKMNVVVSVKDIQKQIDNLSKQFRELDAQIQALNWTVDLA